MTMMHPHGPDENRVAFDGSLPARVYWSIGGGWMLRCRANDLAARLKLRVVLPFAAREMARPLRPDRPTVAKKSPATPRRAK